MTAVARRRAFAVTSRIVRDDYQPRFADATGVADRYALDPLAHLDEGHVRILDLVSKREVVFEPWPNQCELAESWVDLDHLRETGHPRWRNVHDEKSRQMGDTWMLAWLDLWALTYHSSRGLVIRRKFREVDDGGSTSTVKSYFGRVRFMWRRLPDEYRAPLVFRMGQIFHAYDDARFLDAEGADADAGRGESYDRGVLDEAARIPYDEAVHTAITSAIPTGRFYNSTPHGEDNVYARLRSDRPAGFRFLRHHWTSHPVYALGAHVAGEDPVCELCEGNRRGDRWAASGPTCHRYAGRVTSPWYDRAVLELTDEQVAQELDINYSGSLSARVYPEFDELVHVDADGFGVDPAVPVEFSIDFGIDSTAVVFLQDAPNEVRAVGEVDGVENATPNTVAALMRAELARIGVDPQLTTPEWTLRTIEGVGDPAGEARERATGRPLTADYLREGFRIVTRPAFVDATIVATKRLLQGSPKPFVISGPDCPALIDHLKHNRWPTDSRGRRKPNAAAPLNDRHNHMLRGLSYWITYRFPPGSTDDALSDASDDGPGKADQSLNYGMSF